jgi:hypothetical protein
MTAYFSDPIDIANLVCYNGSIGSAGSSGMNSLRFHFIYNQIGLDMGKNDGRQNV